MKIRFIIALLVTLFSFHICVAAPAQSNPSPDGLNKIMAQIGNTVVDIYPYIVAQRKLMQSEIEKVDRALDKLIQLFKSAEPFIRKKPDGYQISYEFISQYLLVAKEIIATQHFDNARSHLYAIGEICASCHTQDTTLRTLFSTHGRSYFVNDNAFAEFNFITRNYEQALTYYEKYLSDEKSAKSEIQIIQPLQRGLTIHIQVRNDPEAGIEFLERYSKLKAHTLETSEQLESWIEGLKVLQSSGVTRLENPDFSALEDNVRNFMGGTGENTFTNAATGRDEIIRVWLRGQLYHYFNTKAKENEVPKLLYWLSAIDRSIAYNFYFSLSDLYLKHCVLKYPTHPYAKLCLNEYKLQVNHDYGKKLPSGIKEELKSMEQALK